MSFVSQLSLKFRQMNAVFAVFGGVAKLQELMTLLGVMERYGFTKADIVDYIAEYPVHVAEENLISEVNKAKKMKALGIPSDSELLPKCPRCTSPLRYSPLNKNCKHNPRRWAGRWDCVRGWEFEDPSKWCGFSYLTDIDHEEFTGYVMREKHIPISHIDLSDQFVLEDNLSNQMIGRIA